MGQKFNQFGVGDLGSNTTNIGQVDGIRKNILGLMGPGDQSGNALFAQRLMKARGHQLDNQGSQRELDSNALISKDPLFGGQVAKSMGLNLDSLSPEQILNFGGFLANSRKRNDLSLSLGNTSGSISAQAAAGQKLTNDQSLAKVMLFNEQLKGDNINQAGLNLQDEATNDSLINDEEILGLKAKTRFTEKQTANLANLMGLDTDKSAATVSNIGATQLNTEGNTLNDKELNAQKILREKGLITFDQAKVAELVQKIAMGDAKGALEMIQIQGKTDNNAAESEAEITNANRITDATTLEINSRTSRNDGQKNNQANIAAGEVDLLSAKTTDQQVQTPKDADLTKAKTNYWDRKTDGQSLTNTLLGSDGGASGSKFDYRKTKTATQMKYNIEEVGQKYTFTKEVPGSLYGTNEEEVITYLWPDDDSKVRAVLTPVIGSKDTVATKAAMEKAKSLLSSFGKDKPDEIREIIKSILQVK